MKYYCNTYKKEITQPLQKTPQQTPHRTHQKPQEKPKPEQKHKEKENWTNKEKIVIEKEYY